LKTTAGWTAAAKGRAKKKKERGSEKNEARAGAGGKAWGKISR